MFYKIENEYYTAEVNSLGAELHSFKSKKTGKEFIWFGKSEIWSGQAPILFPVVGQVRNDTILWKGKSYNLQKHGFARKREFELVSRENSKVTLSLKSDNETLKQYPFEFELLVSYELEGGCLKASHTVKNLNNGEMYFSFGAHPGFNCEIGDTVEFEKNENLFTERISSDNLIIPEKFPLLDNENSITITKEIFEPDALILSDIKSEYVTINSPGLDREIKVTFGKIPFLGIWAKPGAPYVCIEPWFGVNDGRDDYGEFSNKRGIQKLDKGEEFNFCWTAEPEE
ncbi:MAG: aldose 1-epimerase family protein [Clostridia bacterium]|nr:aldose 1-epimerase family protein [Clostridia bacterium]MBR4240829.1 aldose 1-epimerase family protein [Eubacterium sp.]